MLKKNDREIIYSILLRYEASYKQKHKLALQECVQLWSKKSLQLDKLLIRCSGQGLTICEKEGILKLAKGIVVDYFRIKKSQESILKNRDEQRILELYEYIAMIEAENVERCRYRMFRGGQVDLNKIFASTFYVCKLMHTPIAEILRQCFLEDNVNELVDGLERIYASETGSRYHYADCPHCKKGTLYEINWKYVEYFELSPCKCVEARRNPQEEQRNYRTIFMDESIRRNPWEKYNHSLEKIQGVYSFILCKGRLEKETEIEEALIEDIETGFVVGELSPERIALETIHRVLMHLVYENFFDGQVIIYTDNMGAEKKWKEYKNNMELASHFENVKVVHIVRTYNTVADGICREAAYLQVTDDLMAEIFERYQGYELLKKENDKLKEKLKQYKLEVPESA